MKDPQKKASHELRQALSEHGISVSSSTVRRRLLDAGRPAYRPVKKQLLTKAMMKKRYQWAKKYKEWTSNDRKRVVFSDETHFLFQGQRCQFVRITFQKSLKRIASISV